jgi:hypothetical protein
MDVSLGQGEGRSCADALLLLTRWGTNAFLGVKVKPV